MGRATAVVHVSGEEIARAIERELEEIKRRREICLDFLYNVASILIGIGLVKEEALLTTIGKQLLALLEKLRP